MCLCVNMCDVFFSVCSRNASEGTELWEYFTLEPIHHLSIEHVLLCLAAGDDFVVFVC